MALSRGIIFHPYLDGWLIKALSPEQALKQFKDQSQNQTGLISTDNSTIVAYTKK